MCRILQYNTDHIANGYGLNASRFTLDAIIMLLTILVFIIVLSMLVFVHELGHFMVAKKLGICVEEFGFGLPPRLWGKRIGETVYSINWLPIGGFVKLSGEDEAEVQSSILQPTSLVGKPAQNKTQSSKELRRYFFARSKKERAAVLLAGVTMNFFLAVVIISFIFTQGVFVPTERVHVEKVLEDSPAALSGLREKDIIVSFAGTPIKTSEDLIKKTREKAGEQMSMVVVRDGQELTLIVTPRKDPPSNQGPMGVVITNLEEKKYPWYQAPFYGMKEALNMSYLMIVSLLQLLWRLVTFQPVSAEVAGPIGIAQATGRAVQYGVMAVLQLMGILSLNLAIINVLPIPALDGGRLLFVVLEKFMGRRIKPQAERMAHQIGMVVLLALIGLVTINDILRLFRG